MQLITVSEGQIWYVERPLSLLGVQVGTRMTVVKLSSGGLWVHSPVEPDAGLVRELDALGPVRFIVAPSRFHHLFVTPFRERYPGAELYVTGALLRKRPDLHGATVLGDVAPPGWAGEIDQCVMRGNLYLDEVAFFHRTSRTLILADLLESAHRDSPLLMRIAGRLGGIYERPGPPIDMKLWFRDRRATRESIEHLLAWDFDRVILAHGHVIEHGGKDALGQAYAFAFREPRTPRGSRRVEAR